MRAIFDLDPSATSDWPNRLLGPELSALLMTNYERCRYKKESECPNEML